MNGNPATDTKQAFPAILDGLLDRRNIPPISVSGLSLDSRKVESGMAFFALAGSQVHGLDYAEQAIENGAAAIVYDPLSINSDHLEYLRRRFECPFVAIGSLDHKIGYIADRFFASPSSAIDVIGITGTNGKTSCSHFLAQALTQFGLCGVVGTLGWGFIGNLQSLLNTTPDAIQLHKVLAKLKNLGAKYVAMEVSSHGVVQGRTRGVRFKGVAFTKITRDHLDYHGTQDAYIDAKLELLDSPELEFAVINLDDANVERILAAVPPATRVVGYTRGSGPKTEFAQLRISALRHDVNGVEFRVHFADDDALVSAPFFCDFNVENLLTVLAVMLGLGISLEKSAAALRNLKPILGRLEQFLCGDSGPTVIVDYAHTPDALESILNGLREHCSGELWVVFGCGGDRDKGKRPLMGAIAAQAADHIWLTDDNPRSEDGAAIIEDIRLGCGATQVNVLRDRKLAIERIIQLAKPGDLIVIAGKGHEQTQEIQRVKAPFSDRKIVRNAIALRTASKRDFLQ